MLEIFQITGSGQEGQQGIEQFYPGIAAIESAHRDFLIKTPRYERFMTGESIEEWVGALGVDVLSLTHPHETELIAGQFVECNRRAGMEITGSEELTLRLAARIHDFGEIVDEIGGVGDISFDKKVPHHDEQEKVVFDRVIRGAVYDPYERELMRGIYQNIVHGDRGYGLTRMFNAIERVGYLLVAHRAFVGSGGERVGNWRGLVGNVLSGQTAPLISYSREYPMVSNVLAILKSDISAMLDETSNSAPVLDFEGTLSFNSDKLQQAANDWSGFLAA